MHRDLKTGLGLGLLLAAAALVWISTHPGLSPESRLLKIRNTETRRESFVEVAADPIIVPAKTVSNSRSTPEAGPAGQRIHTVRTGETLYEISRKYYGSTGKWGKIIKANPDIIKDANKLRPGLRLVIPE